MTHGTLACHVIARHGYGIERLKRDMAAEACRTHLVNFLAYDAANFVWAFLLASGNRASLSDKQLRDDIEREILSVLAAHGIDSNTFVVWPEIEGPAPLRD